MKGYLLAFLEVTDRARFEQYKAATPAIIAAHEGRFLVRGGQIEALEGAAENRRVVVIEFPTMERARAFWESAQYQAAKKLREGAAEATFFLVEGYGGA